MSYFNNEGIERPKLTHNDLKVVLAEMHANMVTLLESYGNGIFVHPHEIVGCMFGQVKKLSEAADESVYSNDLGDVRNRCFKTLWASIMALASVDCLIRLRRGEPESEQIIPIGTDGRCKCSCGDVCPLGRMGMEVCCTQEELEKDGIKTIKL